MTITCATCGTTAEGDKRGNADGWLALFAHGERIDICSPHCLADATVLHNPTICPIGGCRNTAPIGAVYCSDACRGVDQRASTVGRSVMLTPTGTAELARTDARLALAATVRNGGDSR